MSAPRFKASQTAAHAVLERPGKKAGPGEGGKREPPKPPAGSAVAAAGDPRKTMSVLITGVPVDWTARLDAERGRRGLRSRNALILALLEEALKS